MFNKVRRTDPGDPFSADASNRFAETSYAGAYVTADAPLCVATDLAGTHFWIDMSTLTGNIGPPAPTPAQLPPGSLPARSPLPPTPIPNPQISPPGSTGTGTSVSTTAGTSTSLTVTGPPVGTPGNPGINFPGGFWLGGGFGGAIVGVGWWYGGIDVQGGLQTSAVPPPTLITVTPTNPQTTPFTFTVIGTTPGNLVTAPSPTLTTPIGPNTDPTVANPINVIFTPTPGIPLYNIIQTTPKPGTVATVLYNPISQTATATTPSGTQILGITVTGSPPQILIPITTSPDQTRPLPPGFDTTSQVTTTTLTTPALLIPQLPSPPAPTTVAPPPAGGTNVSYTVVLQTPLGTTTPASSSLSLTSIATPSTTNPVNLQVDLTGIVPSALVPGATVILYRPTNTGGLPNGPIAVGTVVPGTNLVYLTDTGQGLLPNLPTTAPSTGTTGSLAIGGSSTGLNVTPQTNTATVTVTPIGTTGAANYTYKVTCTDATGESVGTAGSTSSGNATLSSTNANVVTWTPSTSSPQSFKVYRTAGGASQGLIGTVRAGQPLVLVDTGIAAGAAAPTTDTTGQLEVNGAAVSTNFQSLTFSVSYTQFTGLGGTSGTITLGSLPSGAGIPFRINHLTTKWIDGGADVVTATLSLLSGPSIDSGYVVSVTAPDWNFFNNITAIKAAGGADSIRLNIATGGSLLSTLSQGALTVTIFYVQGS